MAEQWISAATAHRLVSAATNEWMAQYAICARAHAGLLKARARLLIFGHVRKEEVDVPPRFWWAEGHEALDQNWKTGDFSTWRERGPEMKTFGVTFALSGILAMLPSEEHGEIARSLSVAGSPDWLKAAAARKLVQERAGLDAATAAQAILGQAALGFVIARAVLAELGNGELGELSWDAREWDVPAQFWQKLDAEQALSQDWDRATFARLWPTAEHSTLMKLTEVHFLRGSLQVLFPAARAVSGKGGEETTAANRGGRPPQPWWDELWCTIWGLIHQGDFKPQSQADVERAMLEWAARHGHEVATQTVRPKARLLYKTYQGEVGNFLNQ